MPILLEILSFFDLTTTIIYGKIGAQAFHAEMSEGKTLFKNEFLGITGNLTQKSAFSDHRLQLESDSINQQRIRLG